MITLLPDHYDPDEAESAVKSAALMEARSQDPATDRMFREAVQPLLKVGARSVLEMGCGTAAWSRKIARVLHHANILAVDKDPGILSIAAKHLEREGQRNIQLAPWDVLDEASFPFKVARYDLMISVILTPSLEPDAVEGLVERMARRLEIGGTMVFLEQDLMSDSIHDPTGLARRILEKDDRPIHRAQGLGLRRLLRDAGLKILPPVSHLWVDDQYRVYIREYLAHLSETALRKEAITPEENQRLRETMLDLARARDFYYSMTYNLVAAEL